MNDNVENMIKICFSYTDEFGQKSTLSKSYNQCVLVDQDTIEFLLDEFKSFLRGMGFTEKCVNRIQINYDEE
jgi:hypothetical protein